MWLKTSRVKREKKTVTKSTTFDSGSHRRECQRLTGKQNGRTNNKLELLKAPLSCAALTQLLVTH